VKRLDWYIARRYLASRRKGTFVSLITLISVGGVFVGVAALLIVIAVMTGLQQDLQAKIVGMNPHVYVFQQTGGGFRMPDWGRWWRRRGRRPGWWRSEPFVMTQVAVIVPGTEYAQPGTVFGIESGLGARPLIELEEDILAGELDFGPTSTGYPPCSWGCGWRRS
jgi:lipoprotein-releasing system permease protein